MPVATFVTVGGQMLGEVRDGIETTYIPDPLGNLIETRNETGAVGYTAQYWPYGQIQTETGTNPSSWGYVGLQGYYRDSDRYFQVRTREYDCLNATWTTSDLMWPKEPAYGYQSKYVLKSGDPSGMAPGLLEFLLTRPRRPGPFLVEAVKVCGNASSNVVVAAVECLFANLGLEPCTSSHPNFQECGQDVVEGSDAGANLSHWPKPQCQLNRPFPPEACYWTGDLCCKECQMRVCCWGPPKPPPPIGPGCVKKCPIGSFLNVFQCNCTWE